MVEEEEKKEGKNIWILFIILLPLLIIALRKYRKGKLYNISFDSALKKNQTRKISQKIYLKNKII